MSDKITALIDGDTIPYVVAYNNRDNEEPALVAMDVDNAVTTILRNTSARAYFGFLKGSDNFRDKLAHIRPYKGNRAEAPEWMIRWGKYIREYLQSKWGFTVIDGMEADDACSIFARITPNCIICSTDKDLDQIPGNHYNISKAIPYYISEEEAHRKLWLQVLTGDSTDNIVGLPGCGPKGAEKILEGRSIPEVPHAVLNAFMEKLGETNGLMYFSESYRLVKLLEVPPNNVPLNVVESSFNPDLAKF